MRLWKTLRDHVMEQLFDILNAKDQANFLYSIWLWHPFGLLTHSPVLYRMHSHNRQHDILVFELAFDLIINHQKWAA